LQLNENVNLNKVEYRQAAPARPRNQHNKGRSNNKNNSNNRQRSNNGAKRY